MNLPEVAVAVVRSRAVTTVARRLTRGRLRIVAYHGVPDAARFAEQMEYLVEEFTPVDEQAVIAAVCHGVDLPDGAVWVTFDDGDPTVVNNGLDTMVRLGISATMYICPGLIEGDEPFWWRVTDWAYVEHPDLARSIAGAEDLTEFVKLIDDAQRREIVADLLGEIERPLPPEWRQLSVLELAKWNDAGMALGNHSWDHPCLDQCSSTDQQAQIRRTHDWLCETMGRSPRTFAYPNGNFSSVVDAVIAELGYDIGVLYDNSLTDLEASPLQLSRLMLEADQPVERLIGVLSGAQPALSALTARIRR